MGRHGDSNTSHVIVYPITTSILGCFPSNSNTSHVIVYLTPLFQSERVMLFKYISCYCLSEMADQYEQLNTFKYISCYCLSRTVLRSTGSWEAIQIHLMLLFIWLLFLIIILAVKFKYISCYCLSIRLRKIRGYPRIQIHLMLLFILSGAYLRFPDTNSNTSHVIVYHHLVCLGKGELQEFKYISCYCLSLLFRLQCGIIPGFKYISCYCLSDHFRRERLPLAVFKYISCYCLSSDQLGDLIHRREFKYISCYCLSDTHGAIDNAL